MLIAVDASVWTAAADPSDAFCAQSRACLAAITRSGGDIVIPAFALVEVACALARRLRDPQLGQQLAAAMLNGPLVAHLPLDGPLLTRARERGARAFLRGADALYVAAAEAFAAPLLSWNRELITRAGAVTPRDWLAEADARS